MTIQRIRVFMKPRKGQDSGLSGDFPTKPTRARIVATKATTQPPGVPRRCTLLRLPRAPELHRGRTHGGSPPRMRPDAPGCSSMRPVGRDLHALRAGHRRRPRPSEPPPERLHLPWTSRFRLPERRLQLRRRPPPSLPARLGLPGGSQRSLSPRASRRLRHRVLVRRVHGRFRLRARAVRLSELACRLRCERVPRRQRLPGRLRLRRRRLLLAERRGHELHGCLFLPHRERQVHGQQRLPGRRRMQLRPRRRRVGVRSDVRPASLIYLRKDGEKNRIVAPS